VPTPPARQRLVRAASLTAWGDPGIASLVALCSTATTDTGQIGVYLDPITAGADPGAPPGGIALLGYRGLTGSGAWI